MECQKLGLVSGLLLLLMELLSFQQALGLQLSLQLANLPRKAHLGMASYIIKSGYLSNLAKLI